MAPGPGEPLFATAPTLGPRKTDRNKCSTDWRRRARLILDRLMKIKLDRLLFLVGVGLLAIGVGASILVIVGSLLRFVLNLLG